MKGPDNIKAELIELNSSLPGGSQMPVFNVPIDYFENFAASVLARIKADSAKDEIASLSPLLAGLSRKLPFTVPENYFDSLPVSGEGYESEILAGLDKTMPLTVPAGYFEQFADTVNSRIAKPAKVITMQHRRSWMQVAAAAIITGVIAVSGLFYFNQNSKTSINSQAWIEKKLNNVSDRDLDQFITNTDAVHEGRELAKTTVKPQEVSTMLSDVSVKDMEAFLEDLPGDEEDLSVIN